MKKIHLMLIALPIILAVLASCSDDDIVAPQPEQATSNSVVFMAGMDLKATRVDYVPNGDVEVKCDWSSSDVGKPVKLINSKGEEYNFKITNVTDGSNGKKVARIEYDEDPEEKPFPSRFQGKAVFVVGSGEQVQGDNFYTVTPNADKCAYLGNGAEIEADINIAATLDEIDGKYKYQETYPITFRHNNTCIFRVTFRAPAALASGTKLRIYANGLDLLGEVTLNFTLQTGNNFNTAYVRCTTLTSPELSQQEELTSHNTPTPIEMLTFVLEPPTGNESYVCRKFYSSLEQNGKKKRTNGLESGYFYYTDLTGYYPPATGRSSYAIDATSGEPLRWSKQETPVANAIGFAPLFIVEDKANITYYNSLSSSTLSVSPLYYFHIPLDDNHQYTTEDAATHYLYVGHDVLRSKKRPLSKQEFRIQMSQYINNNQNYLVENTGYANDNVLFFYFGDIKGETLAEATANPSAEHFYGRDRNQERGLTPDPMSIKCYYREPYFGTKLDHERTYFDYAYKYKEDFRSPYPTSPDYYYNGLPYYWWHEGCDYRDLVRDCFDYKDLFEPTYKGHSAFVMKPWIDAASRQWRGGWRCMSLNEANALISATSQTAYQNKSTTVSQEGSGKPTANTGWYQYVVQNHTNYTLSFPATGSVTGTATRVKHGEDDYALWEYKDYENKHRKEHYLLTWLRHSYPISDGAKLLDHGMGFTTEYYYNGNQLGIGDFDYNDNTSKNSSFIADGLPIIPALVVNKATGKPDR